MGLVRAVKYGIAEELQVNRLDAEFVISNAWQGRGGVPSSRLMEIRENQVTGRGVQAPVEPETTYNYCEIGHIDSIGRISPYAVDPNAKDLDPDLQKQTDRIRRKVQGGDMVSYSEPLVLVPKTRPYLGKFALITGSEPTTYFTTALIPLAAGDLIKESTESITNRANRTLVETCFLFLLLKKDLRFWLSALARWGKSYPVLNHKELSKATIPSRKIRSMLTPDYARTAKHLAKTLVARQRLDEDVAHIIGNQGV